VKKPRKGGGGSNTLALVQKKHLSKADETVFSTPIEEGKGQNKGERTKKKRRKGGGTRTH